MLLKAKSSMVTSIDATQRKLMVAIVMATVLALGIVIGDLARGGRPDPPTLRAAATLLDGAWRFRTGDDLHWADADTDDSGWGTIDLTALPGSHDGDVGLPDYVGGWMAHGHPGYTGYAWYRRAVTVPAGRAAWDILGPTLVEDGYELYWNGQRLGGSGRLGEAPRVVGTRPLRFALPADAAGTRGVLAVRAFMLPRSAPSADGGGMHSAPILAPRPISDALHRVQWERTIAGYIVEVIEPIAMLAVIGLAVGYRSRSSHKSFLILASIAVALMAARRLNNAIVAWTDLMDLTTYAWLASTMWVPVVAAWTLAWNRWCLRPWRSVDVAAVVLAVAGMIGAVMHLPSVTRGSRLGSIAFLVVIGARIVRSGPMRILAPVTLASIMAALFGGELLDPIGVPGIWFPFNIGVSRTQYVYAIAVPLLAFLIVRTLSPRTLDPGILRAGVTGLALWLCGFAASPASAADSGVAVLLVDTDRVAGTIDERIYGQFLEEINHSVVDGLYAEQVRGQGFEGKDFADYWTHFGTSGDATLVATAFERGERSVRLTARAGTAGIRQGRFYVEAGQKYDGSLWLHPERGTPALSLRIVSAAGRELATVRLKTGRKGWQEVPFEFTSAATDRQASLELVATGTGSVLVDFISLMRADARQRGKLRPDLLAALQGLAPPFIRWPGGSYASIYKWKDGIGPAVSRKYNPNTIWGGYSDYYGFGTDEFLELCRQLGAAPMIVLAATGTDQAQLQYALEWVHYLVDPPTSEWGRRRAENGHPEPYRVPYIQIDNEPMNHKLSPDQYAAIVNLYGPRLREIAPQSRIVACGQKRSNDMNWSETLIDLAGQSFDILGSHNYEYEPENYATGVRRIEDYLEKLVEYVRRSAHPTIEIAVLEWGASRTYDWRAGLHAAGSLLSYEKLSPALALSSPALLMRNTTDDPEWRSWIYHDHVSWFAGSGYVAEKLFRDYYAPRRLAFASGTFKDIPRREEFFDAISQMKPEDWTPNTVDAIATSSADGRRLIVKAVNYDAAPHTLLTRVQGSRAPASATVKVVSVTAGLDEANSLAEPDKLRRVEATKPYTRDMAFDLPPYTVAVMEIRAK